MPPQPAQTPSAAAAGPSRLPMPRRTSMSQGSDGPSRLPRPSIGGQQPPGTASRIPGTLKRTSHTAGLAPEEPSNKRPASAMATPLTSRHLAPLPPSTLRSHKTPSSGLALTSSSAAAETALLAHDRVRVLTSEVNALQAKLKEQDTTSREATTKILMLERQVGQAESETREVQARLRERDRRVEKLEADRTKVEGRKDLDDDERRSAVAEAEAVAEKAKAEALESRQELEAVATANTSLEAELRHLRHSERQNQTVLAAAHSRTGLLEAELDQVSKERNEWREKHEEQLQAREALEREKQAWTKGAQEDQDAMVNNAQILRDELHRQVTHLKSLESANSRMTRELAAYKSHQTNLELLREENRTLASQVRLLEPLRSQLSSTEVALQELEREKAAWSAFLDSEDGHTFSGPSDLSKALAASRIENLSLRERLGHRDGEIKARDRLVGELEARNDELEQEKEDELERRRAADAHAERAERARELDKRRAEMLAEQLRSYAREEETMLAERRAGGETGDVAADDEAEAGAKGDKRQRELQVAHLEELLAAHQRELAEAHKEASRLRGLLETQGGRTMEIVSGGAADTPSKSAAKASLIKQIQLTEDLEKECDELADENELLKKSIESLEIRLDGLRLALGRGEYNTATTRVLELEGSPAQKDLAVRTATLDALRAENRALLDKLAAVEKRHGVAPEAAGASDGEAGGLVPRESLAMLQQEVSQLQATIQQKETARDRLKTAFAAKAREYREAVHSLLGYKLDFQDNGRVKVTSVFAPSEAYSLVFKSGAGDTGTMALVGGGDAAFNVSQEVRTQMRFWVTERGCIPGFLASLTIELFDGTTRGRAGGYVG